MKTSHLLLVSLGFILAACEPDWEEPYETFTIPEGKHSKGFPMQMLQSEVLSFSVKFDETAKYTSLTTENQWDTNKLLGFSDCNAHHHEHSARFGWRWLDDELQIIAYCYVDGERIIEELRPIALNKPYQMEIMLLNDSYDFYIDETKLTSIPRKKPCNIGAYYMLFPYFGGDDVAPHDINIHIKINY